MRQEGQVMCRDAELVEGSERGQDGPNGAVFSRTFLRRITASQLELFLLVEHLRVQSRQLQSLGAAPSGQCQGGVVSDVAAVLLADFLRMGLAIVFLVLLPGNRIVAV